MLLVIGTDKRRAVLLSDMLYYIGIVSPAVTVPEALSHLSPLYRGVIIDSPESLADCADYLGRIRSYMPRVPIFAVSRGGVYPEPFFDLSFSADRSASEIVSHIIEYCHTASLDPPGSYLLMGIDASAGESAVRLYDKPLGLTRTESMILRYLIRTYPSPVSAEEILRHAFRVSRRPEVSSIRTHICIINRKFRKMRGRNLVFSLRDEGYRILTPEDILNIASI